MVFGIGLGLFAGVAGAGAGCAFSLDLPSVGGPELEKSVAGWLQEEGIEGASSVSCPKRVRKTGDVFACEVTTAAGGSLSVTVKVREESIGWKIERLVDTKSIIAKLEKELDEGLTIGCRERYLQLPAGGAASCEVRRGGVAAGTLELRHDAEDDDVEYEIKLFSPQRVTGA